MKSKTLSSILDALFFQRCPSQPLPRHYHHQHHNNRQHGRRPSYVQFASSTHPTVMDSISEVCHTNWWFAIRIVVICLAWYGASSGQSVFNKLTLQLYPYSLTVTLSSLVNNAIYALPLAAIEHAGTKPQISTRYMLRIIVPIAFGKTIASASAYFGLSKVPISYAQTVKATLPIFTVFAARVMLRERQHIAVYLSLLPIVAGVITASFTELSFDTIGLVASLFSTLCHSFINVLIKKVFDETGMHPIALLSLTSQIGAVLLFPFWAFTDGVSIVTSFVDSVPGRPDLYFVVLLVLSGVCSFVQNLCAFALIHQLTTLSYAVCNTTKRIAVIGISLIFFRNPVTALNCVGMLTAIVGMFIYNRVRHRVHDKVYRKSSQKVDLLSLASNDSDSRLLVTVTP